MLPKALENINDEDNMVSNTKSRMDDVYSLEYTMSHLILNVNTYKSPEYIDHIVDVNLFITR